MSARSFIQMRQSLVPAMQARILLLATLALALAVPSRAAETWQAGVAKVNITPQQFMWMSGYGGRNKPAEGKLTDLWAKALVLQDPDGRRAVLVSLDLVGIDRSTALEIRRRLRSRHGLENSQVAFCTSHTHTGPVVGQNLRAMYSLDDAQWKLVDEYTERLKNEVVTAVDRAIQDLAPAHLAWGTGECTVAVNRRENREADVPRLRAEGQLKGPVDHDVPVLRVASPQGQLRAILFGYACHATVLSFYQWSGDYPGFAQMELEKSHPGAVALFWAGCGADQNPLPRRKVELARAYGARLAAAVDRVLESDMKPITGNLTTRYEEIDLAFGRLPSREELEANAKSSNRFEAGRAQLLLEQIERDGQLSQTYPYPVQAWHLGPGLDFVLLGGEVVVDFSLRLKGALGRETTWVAGYSNDVMAYIPSRRVLTEGGYEGGGAMLYYGLPTAWAPQVEADIVAAVDKLVEQE